MPRCWSVCLLVVCLGCGSTEEPLVEEPPPAIGTDFSNLAGLLEGIDGSAVVSIYEGLPGDFWEPELRSRELQSKPTIVLHGYAVYAEPQEVEPEHVPLLTKLLAAPGSFGPLSANKSCGGFQAEYGVHWQTQRGECDMLICLECGECKIYAAAGELFCDLDKSAAAELKKVLAAYQVERPEPEP